MKTSAHFLALAAFATLAGCAGPEGSLSRANHDSTDSTSAALTCTNAPQGRSYVGFDGNKLEASRVNEAGGINRARIKPYAVMGAEYQRVLGAVPASLAASASSFDDPPARWYVEPALSGVSLNAAFAIAFEGCLAETAGGDFAAAPTADSARSYCADAMRKAWSQSGSPEELDGCVDLATNKLGAEADPHRRWAYVCASILSSTHFLTY